METHLERKTSELEDLRYELRKALMREEKLEYRLSEVSHERLRFLNSVLQYVRKEQAASIVVPDKKASTASNDDRANVSNAKVASGEVFPTSSEICSLKNFKGSWRLRRSSPQVD